MQVRLTRDIRAVPEGEVYPRQFAEGTIVGGNVARAALSMQAGVEIKAAVKGAPETRAAGSAPAPAESAAPSAPVTPAAATDDPPARRARAKPAA